MNLLCTFATTQNSIKILKNIVDKYKIPSGKLYIFENCSNRSYLYLTYNIDTLNNAVMLPNTILIHRKKETNTLYTINSLNSLIREINNGVLDTTMEIPWDNYENMLLINDSNNGLKKIDLNLKEVINTNKE